MLSDYDKTVARSAAYGPHMNDIAKQYRTLAERVAAVAEAVDPDRWRAPSPCEGWSAADVVAHLVHTQREFLSGHGLPVGEAQPVADDPAGAWRRHLDTVTALLETPGVAEQPFDGFFGPTTIGLALARFYGFDMIVHRWDLGRATGVPTAFSATELDQVEASLDAFGEHLYGDGICRPPVRISASATLQDRLLARTGRDPRR